MADPTDANLVKPKTLLDCCNDAQEFLDEYDLNDGYDKGTLYIMRVFEHRSRMLSQFQALQAHAETIDRHGYPWTLTNILRLVFNMANEAGLEIVLSAAYSLKHATDMDKAFPTQDVAFDKAKQMGLTPEQAARQITPTPKGQFALYDVKKGCERSLVLQPIKQAKKSKTPKRNSKLTFSDFAKLSLRVRWRSSREMWWIANLVGNLSSQQACLPT